MFTAISLSILSDLLVNLSATWFAVILIAPGLGNIQSFYDLLFLLTANLPWGILSLLLAIKLAEESK